MTDDLSPQSWDPLNAPGPAGGTWSTSNIGEALPGVPTPMGWSLWSRRVAQSTLDGFHAIGALSRKEARISDDPEDALIWAFFGRGAANVERVATFADRIPGTSGPALAVQFLGRCPDYISANPVYRRYPIVAMRLPWTFLTVNARVREARTRTQSWYEQVIGGIGKLTPEAATALFSEACDRFQHNISVQAVSLFGAVQPLYDLITQLACKVGVDANAIMGGYGSHAETELVVDLWKAGRGELPVEQLIRLHGYHGPFEGEISARVWRETPHALDRIISDYAALSEDRDPRVMATQLVQKRSELERELVAGLPQAQRPLARLVLAAAQRCIPTRGGAKVAFLQATDVARACARHLGEHYADAGALADPEDIFYLTVEEVIAKPPADSRDLVARRRARRDRYVELDVPGSWQGRPTPFRNPSSHQDPSAPAGVGWVVAPDADTEPEEPNTLNGVGVSAGVAEGTVRVVIDPSFTDFEPDEILVARTTDPSWASVMFLSQALIVDIGGALSHAAIVARELGIPCVVNTGTGSSTLRSGDRVRVDGSTGSVEILSRAG
jgi:pyruvate,water dikinase